jgi:hypothetical protein
VTSTLQDGIGLQVCCKTPGMCICVFMQCTHTQFHYMWLQCQRANWYNFKYLPYKWTLSQYQTQEEREVEKSPITKNCIHVKKSLWIYMYCKMTTVTYWWEQLWSWECDWGILHPWANPVNTNTQALFKTFLIDCKTQLFLKQPFLSPVCIFLTEHISYSV